MDIPTRNRLKLISIHNNYYIVLLCGRPTTTLIYYIIIIMFNIMLPVSRKITIIIIIITVTQTLAEWTERPVAQHAISTGLNGRTNLTLVTRYNNIIIVDEIEWTPYTITTVPIYNIHSRWHWKWNFIFFSILSRFLLQIRIIGRIIDTVGLAL